MRLKSIIVGIFFGLLIVLGLAIYQDYGISWDESIQRELGIHTYDYVTGENEKLLKSADKYYGQHFELFLVTLEKNLGLEDGRDIYRMRHLANYLVFVLGSFFFFLLLKKRFRNVWWALLGTGLLVLSPRIFAHSFYNSKDIVFMSIFIIAAYMSVMFMEKKTFKWALVASLFGGLLIGTRVLGIVLPILLIDLFFIEDSRKNNNRLLAVYFILLAVFTIVFWPILWTDTLTNFMGAFSYFPTKTGVVFFGQVTNSLNIPWYYTLGWIAVSTPIMYLVLSLIGLWKFVDRTPHMNREDLMMLGWFVLPLLVTIVMDAILYDAWRHMFFIYPAILYFAILGLSKTSLKFQKVLGGLLFLNVMIVVSFMINNHPHQNIYFNEFVKPPYDEKFNLDYWGLSYKQGYEYIAGNDDRELIKVYSDDLSGETNLFMLLKEDRDRFEFVSGREAADYYLTTYRGKKDLYEAPAFYEILVNDTRILGVHRINK